jgi:hypothetical protein
MPDHFYRFRPAAALLDGFNELERHEIYFPTVAELNDPLEGYKDIVWRGDRIVWRNLFRHYLLCLMQTISLLGIAGSKFSTEMAANLVHQTDADLPQAPVREIYSGVCDAFFGHPSAEVLLNALSRPGKAIRRDELIFYLRMVHYSALTTVIRLFEERGIKLTTSIASVADLAEKSMATLPEVLRLHAFAEDQAEVLFFINNNITQQLALIHELNGDIPDDRRSWLLVARDFPTHYVAAIERLLYPDWHAACFVTDPTGASMWGHYGDGHRGMCLKFKAKPNSAGVDSLDLYRRTSWRGDGSVGYSWVPHPFEAVDYAAEFPGVNFFESLGRVPLPKLSGFWYAGPNGERSEIAASILGGDAHAQWRDGYWQRFAAGCRIKSPQWAHEDEHRIVLHSNMDNLEAKEDRKLKYRFEDLTGIIFGLKTSAENKIAVMRIIERKCVEAGRSDFEFWQAHYSRRTHQIELALLRLLKINPGEADADPAEPGTG